jgi:hypothetical protein
MTVVSLHVAPGADPQRLLREWMPGAWIGAVRQAFGRSTEVVSTPQGELVEAHAPHWLVALWPPQHLQRPFLRRWPRWVSLIAAEAETQALLALLQQVPESAALWVLQEELDWALMAEVVLIAEPGLREYQQRQLEVFMRAEREATTQRIRSAYGAAPRTQRAEVVAAPGPRITRPALPRVT